MFNDGNTFAFMATQLTHEGTRTYKHNAQIRVVCDNVTSPANIGMIFRVCEAMGVEMLYICGDSIVPNTKTQRASRSTAKLVPNCYLDSTEMCIRQLQRDGFRIIMIELTDCSEDLRNFTFAEDVKYAFVVGSENWGISHDVLQLADSTVMIPPFGQNSSMNVATALSICLFECIRQVVPLEK